MANHGSSLRPSRKRGMRLEVPTIWLTCVARQDLRQLKVNRESSSAPRLTISRRSALQAAIGDSSGKDNVLRCNTADDNSVTAVVQALMDQLMYQLLPRTQHRLRDGANSLTVVTGALKFMLRCPPTTATWTLKVHRTMKASAQAWVANIMMCNRRLARQAFGPMDDVPATADTESRRSGLCIPRRAGALAIMFGKRSRGSRQAARSAAGPPPEPLPLEMWFLILSNLTHADMVKCKR